eukprot:SAG11_NODE_2633_length_3151_cov_1.261468_4_plen_222_part_00
MAMPLSYAENGTAEILKGDSFPYIRLFTASPANCSTVPFEDLQPASVGMKWSAGTAALNQSFSGVCWLFGRDLYNKLNGSVPIGLIGDSCGGTPLEHWSTPEALAPCGSDSRWGPSPPPPGISCTPGQTRCPDSILYNALIHPYTVGPMALTGFTVRVWLESVNCSSLALHQVFLSSRGRPHFPILAEKSCASNWLTQSLVADAVVPRRVATGRRWCRSCM